MHASSLLRMKEFINYYVDDSKRTRMLDVGSYSVNGSYRDLLKTNNCEYMGLDIVEGPNVDIVVNDIYDWNIVDDESFDYIISGQAFEHIEYPWLTIREMAKKLKPSGLLCIIAPNSLWEHKYPYDCYRYFSDGLVAMAKWAGLTVIESTVAGIPRSGVSPKWDEPSNDVCLVAGKDIAEEMFKKKMFPIERRFDMVRNYKLHYEFLDYWYNCSEKKDIINKYLKFVNKHKVTIVGSEHIGSALGRLLDDINVAHNILETEIVTVSYDSEPLRQVHFPYIYPENSSIKECDSETLCILTIFDSNRDYIKYLNEIYPEAHIVYLYDIFEMFPFLEYMYSEDKVFIYGAGAYGRLVYKRLIEWNVQVEGFVVSDGYRKNKKYLGKNVHEIHEIDKKSKIVTAIYDDEEIVVNLTEKGFSNIFRGKDSVNIWKYTEAENDKYCDYGSLSTIVSIKQDL